MNNVIALLQNITQEKELVKVLGFTTREVTIIGLLLVILIIMGLAMRWLFIKYDNMHKSNQDTLIDLMEKNLKSHQSINSTLEIIKERITNAKG